MATYFDEKRKTWYCKFRYTDWQGNSKSTSKRGFRTKKEALKYETDTKNSAKEVPKMGLQKLSEEYLADYKLRRKPHSYITTEKNFRIYILPYLGSLPIDKITPLTIRKWQNELSKLNLSESLLYSINISLSAILTYAVKFHNLQSNPMKRVGRQGKVTKRLDFLEQEEWHRLDDATDNLYYKTIFNILYWTGIRLGELLGLTSDDITKEAITINKQLTNYGVTTTKSACSNRTVTIPPFLYNLISDYIKSLYDPPQYIFNMFDRKTINKYLKKYCKKAGIKIISPHIFRHSHASLLINQGVPVNAIAERLGHTPTMTLNIYAHCYKTQGKDIADTLQKINVGQM